MEPDRNSLGRALATIRGEATETATELRQATSAMRDMDTQTKQLSRSLGSSLRSAFDKAVFGGAKLSEVFRGLASDFAGKALDLALKPVQSAFTSGVRGLLGSVTGAVAGAFSFADGAAFSAGRVRAFAQGGVIDGPTVFPLRGATGLMGEAGPEAILPLSRGPDGRLGVRAAGSGAGPVVNVTIQTPDPAAFERSRGQVAATLARAVARGNTRL